MKLLFLLWVFSPVGIYSIVRAQKSPCDTSNRINKLILLWFVFTRYEQIEAKYRRGSRWYLIREATFNENSFVVCFPWLKLDLWERLNK